MSLTMRLEVLGKYEGRNTDDLDPMEVAELAADVMIDCAVEDRDGTIPLFTEDDRRELIDYHLEACRAVSDAAITFSGMTPEGREEIAKN